MSPALLSMACLLAGALPVASAWSVQHRRRRPADRRRRLMEAAVDVTPCHFAVFDKQGVLLASNQSYRDRHKLAFATLPAPITFEGLMRVAVTGTLPPDQVEAEIAARVQLHSMDEAGAFERRFPNGHWMSVTKGTLPNGNIAGFGVDITALKAREAATAESEARYKALVDTASVGIWQLDRAGCTVFGNARLQALMGGHLPAGLAGSGLDRGQSADPADPFGFAVGQEQETVLRLPDGHTLTVLVAASAWVTAADGSTGCVLTLLDITPLKAAQARVEHLAHHDPLTDLGNRAHFGSCLAAGLRDPVGCGLLLVDLDHFKAANDRYGHAIGDELLCIAACRMNAGLRPGDSVCRLGGDEFAVVLRSGDETEARAVGERLLHELGQPYAVRGATVTLSASIGIAATTVGAMSADQLVHAADRALYHVKRRGRAGTAYFSDAIEAEFLREQQMQEALELAPLHQEFQLVFQPQVSTANGQVDCVEALLRWHSKALGRSVPPAEFLPVAAANGLLPGIDAWVLDTALAQMASWNAWAGAPQIVAVNISGTTLGDPAFADRVAGALERHGVCPHRLEIEVPEDIDASTLGPISDTLYRLRAMGVRLALDDLGGGLSSFAHIVQLPVDRLKLDRCIVAGLSEGGQARGVLRAVLAFARGMEIDVVAEGVEDAAQLDELQREGCGIVQGFLTGRPMPPHELRRFLQPAEGVLGCAVS